MNRNNYQSHTSNFYQAQPTYKTISTGFYNQQTATRAPLYPIGPTLAQPEFKPIQRGTSPYVSRQGLMPPSYEQRHRHQTSSNFNQGGGRTDHTQVYYEEREKDLISRNEAEI